ncbi:hypothetical protein [Helicobacter canadensis]|uniref:Lipoprotein n=1 Tax=Helicobacter canadensis MIT 98-5491 TaxID=537970 RepID=C5ZX88_9HELI|nr:hypothetical protein [Helicobacter canadensis]EES89756.1 conserved hypothetical protein [Helicobacter canadensis MIT 98-5491]EFR48550.1 hypothetical protein HCMG_00723 [Helicobacter canadensis MIT 98-5491]STO99794.1 putative lipoprotein [Helicobacter canadensis]
MLKGVLFFMVLFFFGCEAQKSDLMPKKLEESYIQATRKTELIAKGNTQVVVIATHLNEFDSKKYPRDAGEVFFLDIYEANGKKNILKNGYELTLNNGVKPTRIIQLKKEDLEGLILQNATQWGEYYWVEFPKQDKRTQDRLMLILSHKDFGENTLKFGFKKITRP